jgi:hypothetical protein
MGIGILASILIAFCLRFALDPTGRLGTMIGSALGLDDLAANYHRVGGGPAHLTFLETGVQSELHPTANI